MHMTLTPHDFTDRSSPDVRRPLHDPFEGLRVAITGGTSGLGLALVRHLHDRGAHVAFVARRRDDVARVAAQHPGAHGIAGDVSSKADIYPIAMQILGALGGLDVLVNNASDLGPVPLALLGSLAATARDGSGAVVLNISSDAAIEAYPRWGAYGASKAALRHMSRIWNEELHGDKIAVLTLDPGDMDTPFHAAAVPDADRAALKRPETAARELADAIATALSRRPASSSLQEVRR